MKVGDLVCYTHDRECLGLILEQHEISEDVLVLWCDSVGEKYNTNRRVWNVHVHHVEVVCEAR